jgi:hypothetical protein
MPDKPDLKLTSIEEWGDNTEIVELPSGKVAKLRRLNVLAMLELGDDVPNFLKAYVGRSLRGEAGNPMTEAEDPTEAVAMITFLARQTFVYPELVTGEPQTDTQINISVVSEMDLTFAAGYGLGDRGVVQQLERFRNSSASDVELVPAGANVEPEAS